MDDHEQHWFVTRMKLDENQIIQKLTESNHQKDRQIELLQKELVKERRVNDCNRGFYHLAENQTIRFL